MKKKICILLLGGPIPEMEKRLEKSILYVKENPDNEYYFVATGLFSELSFFTEELEKKGFKPTANVFSWDTLSNLEESFTTVWINDAVVATGKSHGMRVKKLHRNLKKLSGIYNLSTIQLVNSEEKEDWKSVFLFFMYYCLWSAKIMSKIAKKLRVKNYEQSKGKFEEIERTQSGGFCGKIFFPVFGGDDKQSRTKKERSNGSKF